VTSTEIVLGKLLAGVGTAWALLAVGALYPLSLAFFGSLDWGPFLSSLVGLMLLVAGYVAIGIFASSLTQSAVIAVISTLILNVMLWFLGVVAEMSGDSTQKSFFEHLNVGTHLMDFMKGNLSVAAFAFFVSLIFLFTFLTRQVVESTRWRA
jgi:ABC-2 type transport system permease protein